MVFWKRQAARGMPACGTSVLHKTVHIGKLQQNPVRRAIVTETPQHVVAF